MSLKRKAGVGIFWSAVEVAGTALVSFVVQLVLARLLLPEEYGTVALVIIFVTISQVIVQAGLGEALVQTSELQRKDFSTVFHLNLVVSILLTLVLWVFAPWVSDWYDKPILAPVLRALSLTLTVSAIGEAPRRILIRNLDFRASSLASIPGVLVGGVVGIAMASGGMGVWSLVGQRLSQVAVTSGMILFVSPMRPGLEFSWQSARRLLPFGAGVAGSNLVTIIFDNLYVFIVGTVYSLTDLGFYSCAQAFQRLPSGTLTQVSNRVLFSVFSSIQDSTDRLREGMRQALVMTVLVAFPLMTFIGVAAKSIVLVTIKDKWLPCVPYLQLFAVIGCLYPLHTINLNVMFAMGKSRLVFGLSFVKNSLTVTTLLLTFRQGITAIICGQVAVSFFCLFVNAHYNKKLLQYSASHQLKDVAPYALASIVAGFLAFGCQVMWSMLSPLSILIVQAGIFFAGYLIMCYGLRLKALFEAIDLAKNLRQHGINQPMVTPSR